MDKLAKVRLMDITVRETITSRGGGIEIDLTLLGYKDEMMTAYQNYLGGGLLSAIGNSCTIENWEDDPILVGIAGRLASHFHTLTDGDRTDWESATFEQIQNRPLSAY
jgi:hypothetical protein